MAKTLAAPPILRFLLLGSSHSHGLEYKIRPACGRLQPILKCYSQPISEKSALYAKASDNAIFHAGAGPCGVELLAVRWSAYYVLRIACILETRLESTERSDT